MGLRRAVLALALFSVAMPSAAQIRVPPVATVATLPTSNPVAAPRLYYVTDGLNAGDCVIGGGVQTVLCTDTGTEWTPVGEAASIPNWGIWDCPDGTDPLATVQNDTIHLVATAPISITGDATAKSATWSVASASTSTSGVCELATSAETAAGLCVQASDTRLADSRTPTAHAATHGPAGSDPLPAGAYAISVTGNAGTADGPSGTPTLCALGSYARGVAGGFAATGCTADDDVPEAGDFGALALTGPITSTGLATSIADDAIALGMKTTGAYAAGDAEAGNATGLACSACVDTTDLAADSVTTATVAFNYAASASKGGAATSALAVAGFAASRCARFDAAGNLVAASADCASGDTGVGGSTGGVDNALLRADGTGGATAQSSAIDVSDLASSTVTLGPPAPVAATGASQVGVALTLAGSNATASTDTAGAAAGGSVNVTAGNAARLTSGNANGGDVILTGGAKIGTGTTGMVRVATADHDSGLCVGGTGSSGVLLLYRNSSGAAQAELRDCAGSANNAKLMVFGQLKVTNSSSPQLFVDPGNGRLDLVSGITFGWSSSASNAEDNAKDTTLARQTGWPGVTRFGDALRLNPSASPTVTCGSANTEGTIYADTSHALCYCDGTSWTAIAGAGSCS